MLDNYNFNLKNVNQCCGVGSEGKDLNSYQKFYVWKDSHKYWCNKIVFEVLYFKCC